MKVRDYIYACYGELVSGTEISRKIARVLLVINFFQIIKNQFWQLGLVIQNNGVLLQYVLQLTQFASMLRLMQKSSLEFFYEALVFAIWLLLNAMFVILIVYSYKNKKKAAHDEVQFTSLRKILVAWNIVLPFFALDVCLEVLLSTFVCTNSTLMGGFFDKSSVSSSYCSSPLRYVLIAVSIEAILLLVIFAVLNSFLFVDDSFNYSNGLARSRNLPSILLPIVKITNCALAVCSIYSYSTIVTSSIFIGLFLVYSWLLHSYHTYYDLSLAEFDMTLFLYQIAISAVPLAQGISIQVTNGQIIPSFVFFCFFLLSFKFARALTQRSFAYHNKKKFNVDSNPVGLDKKIKMLYTTFKYQRELAKINENTANSQHYLECLGFLIKAAADHRYLVLGSESDPHLIFDPMTKQVIDIKSASDSQKIMSPTYVKHLVKTLYQQAIAFHPKSANLRMGLASFLLFELQHIYLTILECTQIKRLINLGWSGRYQLSCFHQETSKLFKDMNKINEDDEGWSRFDLERLLTIDNNFQKLHGSLLHFFQFSKDLYDYILSERPSLSVLEQKSVNQLANYASIQQSFEVLKNNPRSIKLYAEFLREVMGDNKAAKQLDSRLRVLLDKLALNNLAKQTILDPNLAYSEDATLITIGGTRENLGRIVNANIGAEKLFGHSKEELYMSNVKRLMPDVIGNKHDTFLHNFLETSRMTILYKERVLYGRHKEGHVFGLNLLVKPMFDTSTNILQFISFIQPLSKELDHIITDSLGRICGISKHIAKTMKIDPLIFETNKVYLPTLAPKSLYLYLEELENHKLMRRKVSQRRQLSFKRVDTDIKLINRTQDGELLFHVYVSKHLLESSSKIYDPLNPPDSHDALKENFEGSEVYKLRCTLNEFECSDQDTRLKFFCVTEIEFIYKKKTKAAIENSVSSYKTWDKMFFSQMKSGAPGENANNPLQKIASTLKKNFHLNIEPESPVAASKAKSKKRTKLRNLIVKAVKAASQATLDKETNDPENAENGEKKAPEPEKKIPEDKIPEDKIPEKEEQKEIEKQFSFDNKTLIKKASSGSMSFQKTLTHGNTLTVEPMYRKATTNELTPFTKFQHMLSPIPSERELTSQQYIEEESAKENLVNKSSLVQMDSYAQALSRASSALGTKVLSVAQLAHWTDNTNRPAILDNPPANSDSYISEEEVDDMIKKNQEDSVERKQIDSDTTPKGAALSMSSETDKKHMNASLSNASRSNNRKLSKVSNNNTDSFDGFVKKSDNSSTLKKSMSIGTALKFYTDTSKKFKRLLAKTREKTGRIKGINFGSVAKIMVQEKIRNLVDRQNEGSISSGSSKQSNTTKKFIFSSIQHNYIPRAYFTFRTILYLCFIFLIASTLALALEQSQKFTTLENNYDNGRSYVNYINQIAVLGSSVYDLLYLQAGLYASDSAQETSYLYDLSMNKTLNSIGVILENYSVVRTGNEDYFSYPEDLNVTQLTSYSLTASQSLDLTQSIIELCTGGLNLIRDLQSNSSQASVNASYNYILAYASTIVDHMSSKISLNASESAQQSSKTLAILVLVICTLVIAVLWLIAVSCIFKCFVEIQKVLVLIVNLPYSDLVELRNIMDQALHTLQNNEFKYRPPPFNPSTKTNIKRFIHLPFHRFRVISGGIVLLILALLSYTLTIATSHSFDNSLLNLLTTTAQIDIKMYEKYSWELSLKDIMFYITQGYSFNANSSQTEKISELYLTISDAFVEEVSILSQIDTFMASGSNKTQTEVSQVLQDNLCTNPNVSINRTSVFPCLVLFDDSLAEGLHSLLNAYGNFLETNLRNIINNNGTDIISNQISQYMIQLPDLLDYMSAGNDLIEGLVRQLIFANFEKSRWTMLSVSILLCAIQFFAIPIVYFFFLKKLRTRFIRVRRIFGLVPFGILARNPKIKRYLQETTALH